MGLASITNNILTDTGLTPSGLISGSGTSGQVTYWTGAATISGNNNLFWDNANGRLGVGTNTPANTFVVNTNVSGDGIFLNQGGNNIAELARVGTNNRSRLQLLNSGIIEVLLETGSYSYFRTNGLGIGTTTNAGFLLDVNGTTRISGLLTANNIGNNVINTNTVATGGATNNFSIQGSARGSSNGASIQMTGAAITNTITSNAVHIDALQSFQAISTSNTYTCLRLGHTINQISGANGTTRGLYVNPTLTAAADFRAIEWSNNESGTTSWGLYGAGTAPNYMAGALSIGVIGGSQGLRIGRAPTNADSASNFVNVAIPNTSTTRYRAFASSIGLNTSGFTLPDLSHFEAIQDGAFTAGVVTNHYGFRVNALLDGTNVYAFHSNIGAATGRWNIYMAGSADNYLAGSLGIGNTSFAGMNLRVSKSITGSATGRSVYLSGDFQSDVSIGYGIQTSFGTQAATFTLSDLIYFQAAQGTKGGGSTIGTQVGFDVASMTNGSTNIAFRGQNASASNVWNLYMNGTAINYLNGALLIGSVTDDTINKLQVTGTAVAGSKTSTEGSVILRGSYTSGYLTTFGTDASSGGPMLSYAVESAQNSTEASFVSSTPNVTTPRSAYTVSSNHRWYTAPASTTAVGTAISLTKHMELFNSGNLVLGGAAEVAGSKLQVIGNALVKGSTNDATAVALTVQNSDGTNLFRVQNDNSIFLHGTTYIGTSTTRARIYAGGDFSESAHMTSPNNRQVLRIVSGIIANNISDNSSVFEVNQNITSNATVNNVSNTLISGTYTAATGSVNFNGLLIANTINQSGTANGAIRGLYVNPSFTTVTQNWRSIEWSNNTGWGIYGTGVAPNQMNGRLTVSATIPQTGTNGFATFANNRIGLFGAQTIDVPTTAAFNQGTVTAAGTSAQYLTFNGNTTVGGDALLAGSVHINSVQFATTGTITMNNSAAGGQRTMSVMQLQMQKAGIVGGTINRGSTLYLFGVYPTTSTGGTVTFTEYAGLRIGNLMEWLDGTPPNTTVALTNKWGIYQEGPGDPNYFAGAVGVGITTPHPTAKLQVDSLTQGFLPPRMSLAERDAIVNPAEGLIVYVTDAAVNKHFGYNGISWNAFY